MTASDSKSYLGYLNKLVDECNNTYHHSISKKPIDANYSTLTEKIEKNRKASNLNMAKELELLSLRIFFSKGFTKN